MDGSKSLGLTLQHNTFEPNTAMTVILETHAEQPQKILYADENSISFFPSEDMQSAERFFGACWPAVHQFIEQSKGQQTAQTTCGKLEMTIKRIQAQLQQVIAMEFRLDKASTPAVIWKEKYLALLSGHREALVTINEDQRIIFSNPSLQKMLNYSAEELAGKPFTFLLSEDHRKSFHNLWSSTNRHERFELAYIEALHKKDRTLFVSLRAIPVLLNGHCTETHIILEEAADYHFKQNVLQESSYHDYLTKLWNNRMMKIHFAQQSIQTVQENGKLHVVHLGLDRFKMMVESLGYIAGNEFIAMAARRLRSICDVNEKVYRNSGDEFIILVREYEFAQVERLCERVVSAFKEPFIFDEQEYYLSLSIGISTFPQHGSTADDLIEKSKQALLAAKERGRGHYRYYDANINSFTNEALMEAHLRRAIELDELKVYFQPQIDLLTGKSKGFEALLRWENRKFGNVSPAKFIPLAEASGLIHSIGSWVIDQVCRRLKEWRDKQYAPVKVAINISPCQFKMTRFCEKLEEAVRNYDLPPECIEIEITESALMRPDETLRALQQLKKIGFTISVDDFGTGYSSLSYLKKYPIDIIKIDRSFIQDIENDSKNAAIAKTIISLAHSLGMTVIAEGIENDIQAAIMKEAKCHVAQGFLYSGAVPPDIIEQFYLQAENA